MPIRDRGRTEALGQELKNFTDREDQLAIFRRLLDLDESGQLPALMFFGVGGTGKSWLLKHFRRWLAEGTKIPSAYVDFDRKSGGPSYVSDFSALLAKVWRDLDIECPRFEMAYAWMRFKQGGADRPLVRHSGKISTGWELVKEGASAGLGSIPGGGLIAWLGHKLGNVVAGAIQKTPLGKHLLTKLGQEDYLRLGRMTAEEISSTLIARLGDDLNEQLPARQGKRCRAIVFLDTFEDLAGGEQNEARRQVAEEPVRELYPHLTCVLLVLCGRDRLTWDEVDREWADPANLEQHLLGGLSRHDATAFLGKCGIEPGPLLEAILRVSHDEAIPDREAYHPFTLGLCADTVRTERARGIEPRPDTFDMAPGDYGTLARRFLKSLHDEHPEHWIIHLAQAPRFDEAAARAAFSPARDVSQDRAWDSLRDYSFVQPDAEPGWFRIHSMMGDVLRRRLADDPAVFHRAHSDWQTYWLSRSARDTDDSAGLAWYHDYVRNPQQALATWNEKAEMARSTRNMTAHLDLLDWWTPTGIEEHEPKTVEEAAALFCLGVELREATLGNRSANLRRAIDCYQSALRVHTESDFPADWAMTQNNLGNAYRDLPTGDRGENLRRAIGCFEAALRVRTESDFPAEWAMTQNNLGIAYRNLPTGDRGENLRRAVDCYLAALRVRTESDFPAEWAMTQNNLGNAYRDLPTGDRGENLRRAIDCFEATLRVYTESDFPAGWAMTQNNLGTAYADLPTGDRGENLRRAIDCFEAALRVRTESDFPADWAMTQNNLGTAYADLPTGDRGENLRRAIGCFEAALRVRTESDFPAEWAMTQNNLGTAYADLPTGDRGENLRRAIGCFEAALRVRTESDFPAEWAMTQNNLGIAYRNLPTGDRGENLRRAVDCYLAALRVRTESDFPAEWAMTQNNLGIAYADLPTGDRGENLRRAVDCYQAALRVRTESDSPADWAATQNNLGNAYGDLPAGDRGENLRRAIGCFEAALRVRTESDFPADWAMTQFNLGLAWRELRGVDESVQAFDAAARGYESIGNRVEADEASGEAETSRRMLGPQSET